MLRPVLALTTQSELHAVLASGMATVAGTVLALYISLGVRCSISIWYSGFGLLAPGLWTVVYSSLVYHSTLTLKSNKLGGLVRVRLARFVLKWLSTRLLQAALRSTGCVGVM